MVNSDWAAKSIILDEIKASINMDSFISASEAQTRFNVIDRFIKEFLGWEYGQINVEDLVVDNNTYVDYTLKSGDITIVIEAKKAGKSFPSPTKIQNLKLSGSVLGKGDIHDAIVQGLEYSRAKAAQITLITNGIVWVYFRTADISTDKNAQGYLLFPLDSAKDAEALFKLFNPNSISENGLNNFPGDAILLSGNKLLNIVTDSELRLDRNTVADYIAPAMEKALYAESFANEPEYLQKYYVTTVSRAKFDKTLEMHLVDPKSVSLGSVKRIKQNVSKKSELEYILEVSKPNHTPPVTLIIAPVGVGKSTYLKHFQLVKGKSLIEKNDVRWIYIDFYSMGTSDNVRSFLYRNLLSYLNDNTDYKSVIEPAYKSEIDGLKKGILSLLESQEKVNEEIYNHIKSDHAKIEPYVDKVFRYLSNKMLCVLVLDNIDFHESIELEKTLMSEGLAISRRLMCNVIISIRDTTYSQHQNDPLFDAFEFRKLWLDPPPFKEVLSKRMLLSKSILKDVSANIAFENGMSIEVKDLSVFFEIVQSSLLDGKSGDLVEALSTQNTRKGLELVNNFLISGHVQADTALKTYITDQEYRFPFHEVFKGIVLGQRKYYKENKLKCLNIFDSGLNSKTLRLLRIYILAFLHSNARYELTAQVNIEQCFKLFTQIGASSQQILSVINVLQQYGLVKTSDAKNITGDSTIYLTRSGGYYLLELSGRLSYVEACLYDTIIDEMQVWHKLSAATLIIEREEDSGKKMYSRKRRVLDFLDYLILLEKSGDSVMEIIPNRITISHIRNAVSLEIDHALKRYPSLK